MKKDTILIIADSFKGALSSLDTGNAIAKGVSRALRETQFSYNVQVFPAADGGEGTAEALCAAFHASWKQMDTKDLFGHPMKADYASFTDTDGCQTAILDMACCCSLGIAKQYGPNPLLASTYGVGYMLSSLASQGYRRVYVGLGGSGTNDGGMGALHALGARFYDKNGVPVDGGSGGQALELVHSMQLEPVWETLQNMELILLYDVAVPLLGEKGATQMFSRQKGADDAMVWRLESGMQQYATAANNAMHKTVTDIDGTGAAGGLGFGLMLAGGKLCHGASTILDALGIPALLPRTTLVFTGEGKTDLQTAQGKLPHTVARYAKEAGIPCVDLCGMAEPVPTLYEDGFTAVFALADRPLSLEDSMKHTAALAEKTAYNATRLWLAGK